MRGAWQEDGKRTKDRSSAVHCNASVFIKHKAGQCNRALYNLLPSLW